VLSRSLGSVNQSLPSAIKHSLTLPFLSFSFLSSPFQAQRGQSLDASLASSHGNGMDDLVRQAHNQLRAMTSVVNLAEVAVLHPSEGPDLFKARDVSIRQVRSASAIVM
jgi:hypothetical protein